MLKVRDPSIQIRAYQFQDVPRLHSIDQECFPEGVAYSKAELLFYLIESDSVTVVAEQRGSVLGFSIGRIENSRVGHVLTLDVAAISRRQGVGAMLMSSLERLFQSRGAVFFYLEVDANNFAAQAFYEHLGYRRVERIRGYYNNGNDAFRMVRSCREFGEGKASAIEGEGR